MRQIFQFSGRTGHDHHQRRPENHGEHPIDYIEQTAR